MKAMSSGGERDAFYRLSAGMAPKLPTPRQPTALSSATDFFAKVGKIVKSPATALEKWGKAASNIVWEVSETLRVIDELVEYHGGEDQGADIYVLALAYLEQKPDAKLEDRLQRLIREYRGELELQRLWNLLDRHRRRIDRTAVAERALAVRKKIRLRGHDSLREACDVLAARYGVTIEQLLIGEIQETLCSEGAFLLRDEDVVRRTTNRIRRDARAKKELQTVADVREQSGIEDPDFELLRILAFLQQTEESARAQKSPPSQQELQSLAACAYMSQAEAAAELGRSKDQVKIERRRALDKLRKAAEL
jgi:hypothetical protein